MTATATPDFESMSLEEIRKKAEEELVAEAAKNRATAQNQPTSQPRDEHGRFAATTNEAPTNEQPNESPDDPNEPVTFRRVIDLGDGAGTEVFEADTLEELVDKIADAKANATRKIRSQEAELKQFRTKTQEQQRQATADEEFIYSQELLSKPTEAFKKLFKQATGFDISEFKTTQERAKAIVAAQDAAARQESIKKAGDDFIAAHPEFVECDHNARILAKWVQVSCNSDYTLENLEKAYEDLKESGLLKLHPEEAGVRQEEPKPSAERIVPTTAAATPSQRTRKASGLSTQNRPTVPANNQQPSEDDAYKIPLEQLRALANKQLATR